MSNRISKAAVGIDDIASIIPNQANRRTLFILAVLYHCSWPSCKSCVHNDENNHHRIYPVNLPNALLHAQKAIVTLFVILST